MSEPFVSLPTVEVSEPRLESDGIRHITVFSPALGHRADCSVWAPTDSVGSLPLVVLLHGVYGSHWAWMHKGGAHRTAARLVGSGELPPFALACPSDGLFGHGSGYVTHVESDHERWIIDEVPVVASHAIDVEPADSISIVGLSMGGYGALRIGGRHPGRVHAAVGLSSICEWESMRPFVDLRSAPLFDALPIPEQRDLSDVLTAGRALPRLQLACGSEDMLFVENERLHRHLETEGVDHDYVVTPGGHDWPYWERSLEDALRFVAQSMG